MHGGCSSTYELMPAADASPNSCHSQLRICRIVSRLCRPFRGSACMPNTCGTAALSVAACLYRTRRHQLQPACGFAPAAVLGFDASRALVNTPAPTELRRICCFPPTGYAVLLDYLLRGFIMLTCTADGARTCSCQSATGLLHAQPAAAAAAAAAHATPLQDWLLLLSTGVYCHTLNACGRVQFG